MRPWRRSCRSNQGLPGVWRFQQRQPCPLDRGSQTTINCDINSLIYMELSRSSQRSKFWTHCGWISLHHHTNRESDSCAITAFVLHFLFPLSAPPAAAAQTPYDGLWNVTIVTKAGACEPSTRSTLTVADGKVSAPGANVSGSIGREGLVRVSIAGAYANGQLNGNSGSGKWNGASAGVPCSGRWEASRQ